MDKRTYDQPKLSTAHINQGERTTDELSLKLPTALVRRVALMARQNRVSIFAVQLSCWAVVLSRWIGLNDVVIGSRLSGSAGGAAAPGIRLDGFEALSISIDEAANVESLFNQVRAALSTATVADTNGLQPWPFDLALNLSEGSDGLTHTVTYPNDKFDRQTIMRMAACWENLLKAMAKHPRRPLGRLSMLPSKDSEQLLRHFNATAVDRPQEQLVHRLFEQQVRRSPSAIAVEHEDRSFTYAELDDRANQLARYLRARGVGPEQLVAICVERSLEMAVGLLGILKAGAAYVPLDPSYPAERLAYMLEDADPVLVLTQSRTRTMLPGTAAGVVELDRQWQEIDSCDSDDPLSSTLRQDAQSRVYVIYTSGSTGQPKGTEMTHGAMANLIEWHQHIFPETAGVRVLQFAALSFDVAFQETFTTLCAGGTLVLINEWVRRDPQALMQVVCGRSIQRAFLPPLVLQGLAEHASSTPTIPTGLQDVISAGEQLRISAEIAAFFQKQAGCRLHNHYGPTETHVVTALTLDGDPTAWPVLPTIGRPIANTQIYILDRQRQPMPIGVAGEIYIGGANLARGYLNRADLTQQRFVADPFSADPQARLYKTGDLALWRPDGTLEYLGRNDDQVKIRGHRIELAEIEAQLALHANVKETAIVAREDSRGAKHLVAYVALRSDVDVTVENLRAHISARVPQFMVPAAFVILQRLPTTPSGKVDRRALPEPQLSAYVTRPYESPLGETETILADIWKAILQVERVGRDDNFFSLGGDSLSMARVLEQLRSAGWTLDVRHAFAAKSLADLAGILTRSVVEEAPVPRNMIAPGCAAITPEMLPLIELTREQIELIEHQVPGGANNIQDIYPLAPMQQGLLFHHLYSAHGGDTYVVPTLLAVDSRWRLDALLAAIQAVIDRHDVLRTSVLWDELPQPVQVVYRSVVLPVEQVVLDAEYDVRSQVEEWLKPELQKIDLRAAPLLRVRIAAAPHDDTWYVLLQLHHMTGDNISQEIVRADILAHLQGTAELLPAPLPYRNHVAHALTHSRSHQAEEFFRDRLADLEEPTAPFGLSDVHGDGRGSEEARQLLDTDLTGRLHTQARFLGVSAATLFHSAWAVVVAHSSARGDIVFGTVLLGRLQGGSDTQRMLGMFINTLPLRLRLRDSTARQLVEQTQRELAELLNHEHTSLALAQRCSAMPGSTPLFTALLNYRHSALGVDAEWMSTEGIRGLAHRERTNYPITLSIDDSGQEVAITAQTDGRVAPQRILAYMSTALRSLLLVLESAPHEPALSISILPELERRQVVAIFNATQRPYPSQALIHELFERRAEQTPQATALIYEQQQLTYAQLNARANQLATYLHTQGLQTGERVPIVMERSPQLVIAQLAVIKCGGVYVPMDWSVPAERLSFMIRDCGAERVLSDRNAREAVVDAAVNWIDCAAIESLTAQLPADDLALPIASPAAAYVMYTSGSTGVPKGVLVAHHNVLRLVINAKYAELGPEDCLAHCSNPAFDAATFEIWGALLNGATVLVVPQAVVLNANRLAALLLSHRVTALFLTVGLFASYVDALAEVFGQLRYLLTGGDVVDPKLLRTVLQNSPPQHLLNAYGPTESTTFSTTCEIDSVDTHVRSVPIGRPISNTQVYILNEQRQPVPIGVTGEIYIGGAGVALGYLNRPELTDERFVPDPFGPNPRALIYKSGDLGRWRTDGQIEFLGRNDGQVKLRGFRIELGEIEAALTQHPQIKQAAVVVRSDTPGDKRLVAYIVPRAGSRSTVAEVREALASSLPEYMVPSAIVSLERLPLTTNGKLDRRALPAPALDAYVSRAYEPPQGEAEQIIASILEELLHVERVGRDDDFFALGGHSLVAMQVIVHVRSLLSLELSISTLFDFPTVRHLAAHVEQLREARLLELLASGSDDVDLLLERVAAMGDSEVQRLMSKLHSGERA